MDGGTLELLLAKAKQGDVDARNTLVEAHRSFIFNVVLSSCRRSLQWGRDDELSIGLIAFDEAVTRFEPEETYRF
jgi:RNA polymerase sigma factor